MASLRRPANPTPAQRAQWLGISRIDQPSTRTFGWFVRLSLKRQRDGSYTPRFTRFFGDASHGGPGKALTEARKWRDQQLKNAPKKATKKKATKKKSATKRKATKKKATKRKATKKKAATKRKATKKKATKRKATRRKGARKK